MLSEFFQAILWGGSKNGSEKSLEIRSPHQHHIDSGTDIRAFLQGRQEKSSEIHSPHQDNMDFHPDIQAFLQGGLEKSLEKGSEKSSEKNGDGGLEPASDLKLFFKIFLTFLKILLELKKPTYQMVNLPPKLAHF